MLNKVTFETDKHKVTIQRNAAGWYLEVHEAHSYGIKFIKSKEFTDIVPAYKFAEKIMSERLGS